MVRACATQGPWTTSRLCGRLKLQCGAIRRLYGNDGIEGTNSGHTIIVSSAQRASAITGNVIRRGGRVLRTVDTTGTRTTRNAKMEHPRVGSVDHASSVLRPHSVGHDVPPE
jgi:hypothetical protein